VSLSQFYVVGHVTPPRKLTLRSSSLLGASCHHGDVPSQTNLSGFAYAVGGLFERLALSGGEVTGRLSDSVKDTHPEAAMLSRRAWLTAVETDLHDIVSRIDLHSKQHYRLIWDGWFINYRIPPSRTSRVTVLRRVLLAISQLPSSTLDRLLVDVLELCIYTCNTAIINNNIPPR